jgi:hypothetical protein
MMTSWKVKTCSKQIKTNVTVHATIVLVLCWRYLSDDRSGLSLCTYYYLQLLLLIYT